MLALTVAVALVVVVLAACVSLSCHTADGNGNASTGCCFGTFSLRLHLWWLVVQALGSIGLAWLAIECCRRLVGACVV